MNDAVPLTPQTFVVRSPHLLGREVGDEVVMIDLDLGNYYGLDPIAADIWEQLALPVRVCDLCAALRRRYAVDEEQCLRDVLALLEQLKRDGLVLVTHAPEP